MADASVPKQLRGFAIMTTIHFSCRLPSSIAHDIMYHDQIKHMNIDCFYNKEKLEERF